MFKSSHYIKPVFVERAVRQCRYCMMQYGPEILPYWPFREVDSVKYCFKCANRLSLYGNSMYTLLMVRRAADCVIIEGQVKLRFHAKRGLNHEY